MSEPFSRIGEILESASQLTLEAATSVTSRLADQPVVQSPKEIHRLLGSRSDRDKLSGIKQATSIMAQGGNSAQFFPSVVKNISTPNIQLRKLVYVYLLRHASKEPDLALLSINAIQKSLTDKNAMLRTLSLRVMSSINISVIAPIVLLGIKRAISDSNPGVRRAAAFALAKHYEFHSNSSNPEILNMETLIESLEQLLRDKDMMVIGAALIAFKTICPGRLELLHGHIRRYCRDVREFDEWSQINFINIFMSYAREYLPKPQISDPSSNNDDTFEISNDISDPESLKKFQLHLDPDLQLFLESILCLLYSRNAQVMISVSSAYFYLAPSILYQQQNISTPLVRILNSRQEGTKLVVLKNILSICMKYPSLFYNHISSFFLFQTDAFFIAKSKLEILSLLITDLTVQKIIPELKYYATVYNDSRIAAESVKSLGRCAFVSSEWSNKCLKWLLKRIKDTDLNPDILSECLTVIIYLIQQDPQTNIKSVARLSRLLDTNLVSNAKASIIWLVGEFAGIAPTIAPDLLRKLLKNFAYEPDQVRYQIMLLAAKTYSYDIDNYKNEHGTVDTYDKAAIIPQMLSHTLYLARYDSNYDTRDRARMLQALLLTSNHYEVATLILQAPKPPPSISLLDQQTNFQESVDSDGIASRTPDIGTLSHYIGHPMTGYKSLQDWRIVDKIIDSSIRTEIEPKDYSNSKFTGVSKISNSVNGIPSQKQPQFQNTSLFPTNNSGPTSTVPKYKLQSLDDFFSEQPKQPTFGKPLINKTVHIEEEEETSSEEDTEGSSDEYEEEEEEEEEEDDDEEEEDEDEEEEEGSSDEYEEEDGDDEDNEDDEDDEDDEDSANERSKMLPIS